MIFLGREFQIERFEDKLKLARKYQKYVYMAVITIVLINVYFSFITPKIGQVKEKSAALTKYEQILESKRLGVKEKENIEKKLNDLKTKLEESENQFFSEDEYKEFALSLLPKMAIKRDIDINNISFEKSVLKEKIYTTTH